MDSRRKVFPVVGRARMVSPRPKWAGVSYTNKSCTSWVSIYAVQTHLKAMGLYPYEPDGKWGVATYNALVKSGYTFQQLSGGCTPPVPPGILGRAAADWPGYPEPIPPTCWNNPAFQEEYWEKNNKLWDEAGVEAEKTLKEDPNSTCGVRSGSTAIKPSVRDCQQMLFEPRHDKMARDLMAKYDCLEGGSGAASESAGSDGGSSGSGSSSTNFMLWGLGAAALIGGLGWFFLRGPGQKYMGNPIADFDGDQHDMFDELVLRARNDGDSYRKRDAAKAVKNAWKELRADRAEAMKEDYDVVRPHVEREVLRLWSKDNPLGSADEVREQQGWDDYSWIVIHEDFIDKSGLREAWDEYAATRAGEENEEESEWLRGDADEIRERQGWNDYSWIVIHEDFIDKSGLREAWDKHVAKRARSENR